MHHPLQRPGLKSLSICPAGNLYVSHAYDERIGVSMKRMHIPVLIVAAVLVSFICSGVFAADSMERQIDWINQLPELGKIATSVHGNSFSGTYSYSGDWDRLFNIIRGKLRQYGWTITGDSNTVVGGVRVTALQAVKQNYDLRFAVQSTMVTAPILAVNLLRSGHSSGGFSSGGHSLDNPSGSSAGVSDSGYQATVGDVMSTLNYDVVVPEGKVLNLMATLNGNLLVKKNATANIQGTINGNIINYGTLNLLSTVNGNIVNHDGTLNIMGKVNGEIIRK